MGISISPCLKSKLISLRFLCKQKTRKIGCKLGKFLDSVTCRDPVAKDSSTDEDEDKIFTPRASMHDDGDGYDCSICTETKPVYDCFDIKGCSHVYCAECTVKYIESKLDDNAGSTIKCPELNCEGVLDPEFCRGILPRALFNRWGNSLCESAFLGSEKFYCPYNDCSVLLINDGERVIKKSKCPFCKRKFCVLCKVPWHSGFSCAEFQKLEPLGPDALFAGLAGKKKRWKRCPYCKNYVGRSFGCNYIKCRCGKAFCYNCGGTINSVTHACYGPRGRPAGHSSSKNLKSP
ncbi:GDSL esterase/lipase 5 [Hibiscus syriacus]|uniref:RBR-type E3 ubiquitin transferase n=1 Tax=Hibiscus syriacus TaxID=106335 RepID=A0A6A2ZBQ5_HIBSY|nr:E3 ubiquitin-protein ligase RNF144B-like [Hibiscus syriacus]KAE8689177.1 GDSL esterase/lipase 5 [Hibiscus syriacus]